MYSTQGLDLRGDRGGGKKDKKKRPKKEKADKGIQRRESAVVSQGAERPSGPGSGRSGGESGTGSDER